MQLTWETLVKSWSRKKQPMGQIGTKDTFLCNQVDLNCELLRLYQNFSPALQTICKDKQCFSPGWTLSLIFTKLY